ncbi:MAG TPA: hypothetical protein VEX41_01085 [Candidatus Eisenbacteria bacterium]|nr:hypothetical protein [Candidatus Eisenbacteria bacterium]
MALQRAVGNRALATALEAATPSTAQLQSLGAPSPTSPSLIAAASAALPGLAVFPIPIDIEGIVVGLSAQRSVPAGPPGGANQIRDENGGGSSAAGYTSLPAPTPPELVCDEPQRREDGWVAPVRPTAVGGDAPVSLYPAPGVHDLDPGAAGQERHLHVTADASSLIRQGEDEHLLDLEWARHLSYDRAAAAVNAVAASPPTPAPDAAEARRRARRQVQDALPRQLRSAPGADPVAPWIQAYSRLAQATHERDNQGWHDLTSAFVLDPQEKRRLGVPEHHELKRYTRAPGIGKHPSAELMRARFNEL